MSDDYAGKLLHTDLMWDTSQAPSVHVWPTDKDHEPKGECWCRPRIDYTDPVNGGRVWVHQAVA